jgi:hypothetical protein
MTAVGDRPKFVASEQKFPDPAKGPVKGPQPRVPFTEKELDNEEAVFRILTGSPELNAEYGLPQEVFCRVDGVEAIYTTASSVFLMFQSAGKAENARKSIHQLLSPEAIFHLDRDNRIPSAELTAQFTESDVRNRCMGFACIYNKDMRPPAEIIRNPRAKVVISDIIEKVQGLFTAFAKGKELPVVLIGSSGLKRVEVF